MEPDPHPDRYQRQTRLTQIGREGQQRLQQARVLLVGCGALGTGIADLLVRAGVGMLRVCDRDFVELHNLHRQTLFGERDAQEGRPKAVAAAEALRAVNSTVVVEPRVVDVNAENVEGLLSDVDVVLDGLDNAETRYLLNDACCKHRRPWVYGGCVATFGLVMPVLPGVTACLRCVFPEPAPPGAQPTCDTAGVLNAAVAAVSAVQVAEAVKLLVQDIEHLQPGLLQLDLWASTYRTLSVKQAVDCPCCVGGRYEFLEGGRGSRFTELCGRDAIQIRPEGGGTVDLHQLAQRLAGLGDGMKCTPFLLRVRIDGHELTVFTDGRAIIKGTSDPDRARALYARYVGS